MHCHTGEKAECHIAEKRYHHCYGQWNEIHVKSYIPGKCDKFNADQEHHGPDDGNREKGKDAHNRGGQNETQE